jgi:hypothetical protein
MAGKKVTCPKCGKGLMIKGQQAETLEPNEPKRPKAPEPSIAPASYDPFPSPAPTQSYASPPLAGPTGKRPKQAARKAPSWLVPVVLGALAILGTAAGYALFGPKASISSAFRPAENASKDTSATPNRPSDGAPSGAKSSGANGGASPEQGFVAFASLGPEKSTSSSPAIQVAEEFVGFARKGQSDRAVKMIAPEDFDKRQKDGASASWEAIMKDLEAPRVLNHMVSGSLESTPLNDSFRHWRVLGETVYQNEPAVLLRYYSDPEYPRELITGSGRFDQPAKLEKLAKTMTFDEFNAVAEDLIYGTKSSQVGVTPDRPETLGFLPPRFGYLMLILEPTAQRPKVVDIVSVLGQVPMSQIAGAIYLKSWKVISTGSGSESEYKARLDKAARIGKKTFSIYGTVPGPADSTLAPQLVPAPGLWYRWPEEKNAGKDPFEETMEKSLNEWLSNQTASRTTRLFQIAQSLQTKPELAPEWINKFRDAHAGDPGADLAVISFAMTSIEPRMPESLLGVIDDSAERLYKTFNDPFMLYVRALVQQARGDSAGTQKMLAEANRAGFISMRMLREPFEEALKREDKPSVMAALKQISKYWSQADLDKPGSYVPQFRDAWNVAKQNAEGVNSDLVQRDAISGGLGRRGPVGDPANRGQGSGPIGGMGPRGFEPGPSSRGGGDPRQPPTDRPSGQAGPSGPSVPGRPANLNGERTRPGPPGGFGPAPPAIEGSRSVRFVIQTKTSADFAAILEKLKQKLGTGNFQMSASGNSATITLGFEGPFQEAVTAVDFGKVTKQDEATRTITVEAP